MRDHAYYEIKYAKENDGLVPDSAIPGCDCVRCGALRRGKDPDVAERLEERARRYVGARRVRVRRDLPVAEARRRDILAVVRDLGLGEARRRGVEWWLPCPFHPDNSPSMRLNADKGLYYCDVCAFGGDVIDLTQRIRGESFVEAVEWLAG